MADKGKRAILWEVGCEGHTDAWVTADNWELATVAAAEFWRVPWREVAAKCELKQKITGAPRNICCRCGRTYYGGPPMCSACKLTAQTEEALLRRRLKRAYQTGKAM